MDAIEAGTRIAAQVLGMENQLGTIEEGKLADLVLIEGNPLEDIEILLKRELIRLVIKGGKKVSGEFS
jgi:imidazolonepropionase-like amidohydrolase